MDSDLNKILNNKLIDAKRNEYFDKLVDDELNNLNLTRESVSQLVLDQIYDGVWENHINQIDRRQKIKELVDKHFPQKNSYNFDQK
ncbi:MAG: hypothetical protein K2X69_02610 [Silvanigrellaceae bacterium]|nr:hypothetical protein [Silvanigrellaceae bacterium]